MDEGKSWGRQVHWAEPQHGDPATPDVPLKVGGVLLWPPWGSTASPCEEPSPGGVLPPSLPAAAAWRRPSHIFSDKRPVLFYDGGGGETRMLAKSLEVAAHGGLAGAFARALAMLDMVSDAATWTPSAHVCPWEYPFKSGASKRKYYAVRLFFLGCWRRIVVDECIPVDIQGTVILPSADPTYVLWPYYLFKALAQIASLSWTSNDETRDFSVIECLSGYLSERIPLTAGGTQLQWAIIKEHLAEMGRYQDDTEQDLNSVSETRCTHKPRSRKGSKLISDAFNIEGSFILVVVKENDGDWRHLLLLEGRRLDTECTSTLEQWRKVRWVEWARRHNVPFFERKEYCVLKVEGVLCERRRSTDSTYSLYSTSMDFTPKSRSDSARAQSRLSCDLEKHHKISETMTSTWISMDDLSPILHYIEVLRMPHAFNYSCIISDLAVRYFINMKTGEDDAYSRQELEGFYHYQNETESEPVYLYLDSENVKNVVFHLSVMPATAAIVDREAAGGSLLMEEFRWWDESSSPPLCVLRSGARAAGRIRTGEGRYVLRLWLSTRACVGFVLRCFSDSRETLVAAKEEVMRRMGKDSVRVLAFGSAVRSVFTSIAMHFGRPEAVEAAKTFRRTLQSTAKENPQTLRLFIDSVATTVSSCGVRPGTPRKDDLTYALNLAFSTVKLKGYALTRIPPKGERSHAARAREEAAARILQGFFRRVARREADERRRQGVELSPRRPRRALRRLADVMCEPEALWHVLGSPSLADLLNFSRDFLFTVRLREWSSAGASSGPWGAVFRAELRARGASRVSVSVTCDALPPDSLVVRLLDNDQPEEERDSPHPRGVQLVTQQIATNERGFTVFAHVPDSVDTPGLARMVCLWRMRLCTPRPGDELVSARIANLLFSSLQEPYVPCSCGLIGRCLLRTRQRGAVVSLRFSVSCPSARFLLRVEDPSGETLAEVEGVHTLVLPAVVLESKSKQENPRTEKEESPRKGKKESPRKDKEEKNRKDKEENSRKDEEENSRKDKEESPRKDKEESPRKDREESPRKENEESPRKDKEESPRIDKEERPRKQKDEAKNTSPRAEVFVVEARVVGDSWPLSDEEWKRAEANSLTIPKDRRAVFHLGLDGRVSKHSKNRLSATSRISLRTAGSRPGSCVRSTRRSPSHATNVAASAALSPTTSSRPPSPQESSAGLPQTARRRRRLPVSSRPSSRHSASLGSTSEGSLCTLGGGSICGGRGKGLHSAHGESQMQTPWWRLQVAADTSDRVEVALDCSVKEKTTLLQQELERGQPGRAERARAARVAFLKKLRTWDISGTDNEKKNDAETQTPTGSKSPSPRQSPAASTSPRTDPSVAAKSSKPPQDNALSLVMQARILRKKLMEASTHKPDGEVTRPRSTPVTKPHPPVRKRTVPRTALWPAPLPKAISAGLDVVPPLPATPATNEESSASTLTLPTYADPHSTMSTTTVLETISLTSPSQQTSSKTRQVSSAVSSSKRKKRVSSSTSKVNS